jgi:dipicolinate synthase subunit B
MAHGITDGVVTMAVKAQLRNRRPVVIAIATNDGLGANLFNIAMVLEKKNVYFVPFGQDDAYGKPTSLICDFKRIPDTLDAALRGRQLQPVLLE